jgi:phosphonopyruvate decarboxylase
MADSAKALDCAGFYQHLVAAGVGYFTGVPDSLLSSFGAYLEDHAGTNHTIAANEGNAVGIGLGNYLATGKIPLVYMQNSGQGNVVNPLLSLADREVYGTPMLLMIGWRGEPGAKDEPQHVKQGRVTLDLLEAMEIPYVVLSTCREEAAAQVDEAVRQSTKQSQPYALVVSKGTFAPYKLQQPRETQFPMDREGAVKHIIDSLDTEAIVVSTTGKTSREVFEYREALEQDHARDFLTVGGMGHASSIALGIAEQKPDRRVYCIDGDGALLMHLGGLAIIGTKRLQNFVHVLINNGAHDSVGGQPTVGFDIHFPEIAAAVGYRKAFSIEAIEELQEVLQASRELAGPLFIEIRVNKGARDDLGRPTTTPAENRDEFMKFVQGDSA